MAIKRISVQKPRIGYPEAIFAGVDPSTFTGASLHSLIADALAYNSTLNVPDPDVDRFAVTVEARMPAHDSGTSGTLPDQTDGVYRIELPFNATAADPDPTVNLDYQEIHQISRDLIGVTVFSEKQVESILTEFRLSTLTPLSILAVELFPGDDLGKTDVGHHPRRKSRDLNAEFSAVDLADEAGNDPLGSGLGSRRILRTSVLTPVPPIC